MKKKNRNQPSQKHPTHHTEGTLALISFPSRKAKKEEKDFGLQIPITYDSVSPHESLQKHFEYQQWQIYFEPLVLRLVNHHRKCFT
jgi:hypothetical protein